MGGKKSKKTVRLQDTLNQHEVAVKEMEKSGKAGMLCRGIEGILRQACEIPSPTKRDNTARLREGGIGEGRGGKNMCLY